MACNSRLCLVALRSHLQKDGGGRVKQTAQTLVELGCKKRKTMAGVAYILSSSTQEAEAELGVWGNFEAEAGLVCVMGSRPAKTRARDPGSKNQREKK